MSHWGFNEVENIILDMLLFSDIKQFYCIVHIYCALYISHCGL